MRYFFLIVSCLTLWQCSTPIVSFQQESTGRLSVPARITFQNKSDNAESYRWTIDGIQVSDTEDLTHTFYESGRHNVTLIATSGKKQITQSQEIIIHPPTECTVLMETTEGDLVMTLSELTPRHRDHFTELVDSGYYDGIFFHRVIDDFMIQGGNNISRKSGKRYDEPATLPHEIRDDLLHYRGVLAAARNPDEMNPKKESSGSQFYIVDGRNYTTDKLSKLQSDRLTDYTQEQFQRYIEVGGAPQLDGEYTIFGQLVLGFDVLDKIAQTPTDNNDQPSKDITIIKARNLN